MTSKNIESVAQFSLYFFMNVVQFVTTLFKYVLIS